MPNNSQIRRYIRLLSNVLDWQKGQDRNGLPSNNSSALETRVKSEPTYFGKPGSPAFFKQEKNPSDLPEGYKNYSTQRLPNHSFLACDRNGNNLLMIAPVVGNVVNATGSNSGRERSMSQFPAGGTTQNGIRQSVNFGRFNGVNGNAVSVNGTVHKRLKVEAADEDQTQQSKGTSPALPGRKRTRITLPKDSGGFRVSDFKNVSRK